MDMSFANQAFPVARADFAMVLALSFEMGRGA
jgi:hypothetical protein